MWPPLNPAGRAWNERAKGFALPSRGALEGTISKSDAIDCALTYGWVVDGQLAGGRPFLQGALYPPRRPRSAWSQVNRQRIEKLKQAGRMSLYETRAALVKIARPRARD